MSDEELNELILTNFTPYDRRLSLAIDECYDALDRWHKVPGIRAWLRRWWWGWKLRRLERGIP